MSVHRILVLTVLLAILTATLGGCASSRPEAEPPVLVPVHSFPGKQKAEPAPKSERKEQEAPDMYASGGDDWTATWAPTLPTPERFELSENQPAQTASAAPDSASGDSVRMHQERGYRVQLANVMSEDQAKAIEARASALFDAIYIIFRSPNYKVRAGDFTRRADADRAAAEAKRLGFRGAWVVPDRVYVKD